MTSGLARRAIAAVELCSPRRSQGDSLTHRLPREMQEDHIPTSATGEQGTILCSFWLPWTKVLLACVTKPP